MKKEKENGMELTANKSSMESNNAQVGNQDERKTISKGIKSVLNFITVEPFLFCYILPQVISALAVQKLNFEKACRADLNFTAEVCAQAIAGGADNSTDNITSYSLNSTQKVVTYMTIWTQPLQSAIPAIVILFVGAWSDRTGNRKALMVIPLLGQFISTSGLILATYYFLEWPLWITGLIESLPSALCGGTSIALMGSYSYVADVTTVDTRTFRIGIVAVIVTLGIPLGSSISGILVKAVGYYGVFGISLVFYIIGFVHTLFWIRNAKASDTEGTFCEKLVNFFHPRSVWETISLVVTIRGRQFIQIMLVIWAHIVILGPVFGESGVLFLYTLKKYQMDVVDFSLYSTYSVLMSLTGTAIAVTVFSKRLKMHDAMLGIIATACKVVSSFVYAFAPTRGWFYSGPAFDFFGNSGITAIRSLGTKIVEPDQVGKMCSIIGFAEAIMPVVYTPMYSTVYYNTLDTFSGAFYLLGGIMTIPAFFIFIFLYIIQKKQQRDVVKNPEAKEIYAHDNALTSL